MNAVSAPANPVSTGGATPVSDAASDIERGTFMAFIDDDLTRGVLVKALEEMGWDPADAIAGDINAARSMLAGLPTPGILLVDLSEHLDPVEAIDGLADVCDPGTRVIALGAVNDVDVYRALMAQGVFDYLVKPVTPQVLSTALVAAQSAGAQNVIEGPETVTADTPNKGMLTAVIGARGGVGATTVAVNIASSLVKNSGRRVALIDLDLHFGTSALMLDLEPGKGFLEALESPERIDSLFIERAMTRAADNLYLLAAEEDPSRALSFASGALGVLFDKLRESFDAVIVDVPRESALTVAPYMDRLVLVTDPTLAGFRDGVRLRKATQGAANTDLNTQVVLNRGGTSKNAELKAGHYKAETGLVPDLQLPEDNKAAVAAAGAGKALVDAAPKSKVSLAIAGLAEQLYPSAEDVKPKGLFKRLLRRAG